MLNARRLSLIFLFALLPIVRAKGETTLIWISLDGVRADYLDRGRLPFFQTLLNEGAYSRHFQPSFPPITFPSHCSEATGVTVEKHGITGNSFYDSETQKTSVYPDDASLLQAEPIWLTAQRQGVRTLAYDWPLSQGERGALHADYFNERFDKAPSDAQRLDHLLDTWRQDSAAAGRPPLRFLMAYLQAADPVGHQAGPDSPAIAGAMELLDATLSAFREQALALWKAHAAPDDRFYLLLTTDHGMSGVEHLVHLEKMLGLLPRQPDVTVQTVGNMGNVFLSGADREPRLAAMIEKLRAWPFVRVFRREDLPAAWGYRHPTRTGDFVAILPKGYTYSRAAPEPVSPANSPKGMHGYPVEENPEMEGVTILWRYPQLLGGQDLGVVRWDQLHPTVARLLGVQPAPGAGGAVISLPGEADPH